MIEAIKEIGDIVLKNDSHIVEALIREENIPINGSIPAGQKRKYLVVIDIPLELPECKIKPKEISYKLLQDVLWVGNAPASNDPQDRLTTNHIDYLVSQTAPNLYKKLVEQNPECDLCQILKKLQDTVYIDIGPKDEVIGEIIENQYERYRKVWDLVKLKIAGVNTISIAESDVREMCEKYNVAPFTKSFLQAYAKEKQGAKKVVELIGAETEKWICKKLDISKKDILLYTLAVNGKLLVECPEYIQYLEINLLDEAFVDASSGVCHVCGDNGIVTGDMTRFKLLKFYNTDKPGFAMGLNSSKFYTNYGLCKKCYKEMLAGERFVENNFKTRLGDLDVYVIPHFFFSSAQLSAQKLKEWGKYLKKRLSATQTLDAWKEFQEYIKDYQEKDYQEFENVKGYFVLNFLFVTGDKSAVKIDKLIEDVPPSRLDRLDKARNCARKMANEHLGYDLYWDLGLESIFYLFPLHKEGKNVQKKLFLDCLDKLLTGSMFSPEELIPQFLETACVYHFRNHNYVQEVPDQNDRVDIAMVKFLLQSQLFLCYLRDRELNLLYNHKGGKLMENELPNDELHAYIKELKLEEKQAGLFLLGYLIGEIGSTESQRESGKPILNKIDFRGMDQKKIMRLANEIFEKLRQYKIVDYNEAIHAEAKNYLDHNRKALYSPQENTYWVLSGYAYATWQAIRHGKAKVGVEEQEQMEVMQK